MRVPIIPIMARILFVADEACKWSHMGGFRLIVGLRDAWVVFCDLR
jgi:hypothetical protein